MGNERYPRNTDPQSGYYNRSNPQDYGRDYGSGSEFSYSSARDYGASGELDNDRGYRRSEGGRGYGGRDYGERDRDFGARNAGGYGGRNFDNRGGGERGRFGMDRDRETSDRPYYGSYGADGRRFVENRDNNYGREDRSRYGRQPQGYEYDERGFFDRAGDEVRSWFGDEDAERRREADQRYEARNMDDSYGRDSDYHSWRRQQIDALDRDYAEYRHENREKFHNEFGSWRSNRQRQRNSLNEVREQMEVLGSDGEHVGTVDKVRGDRILLTKDDKDADGHHHSIPSRWIQTVEDKVTIDKTADEAHRRWKDEDGNQAMFGDTMGGRSRTLNRSFSGTY